MPCSPGVLLFACLLALPSAAAPVSIGRLFHTPAERARLDRQRQEDGRAAAASDADAARVTLQGLVWRNDGRVTTWLNQQEQHEDGRQRTRAAGQAVRLPSGTIVHLQPGQTVELASGTVQEADDSAADTARRAPQRRAAR